MSELGNIKFKRKGLAHFDLSRLQKISAPLILNFVKAETRQKHRNHREQDQVISSESQLNQTAGEHARNFQMQAHLR